MSVIIKSVDKGSKAYKVGLKDNDVLLKINEHEITDVLDYRFYQNEVTVVLEFLNSKGISKTAKIKKDEYEELGLNFETYLMDEKRSCRNKCIFCFIDQLPGGLRESLYFKDDDSRLSFLFGNYITLTNITEHEVQRIINMHISPVNISVHTTDPELRVKMMANKNAGKALETIDRFNLAGIKMNCQLVLCPGINDGAQLEKSLSGLTSKENIECIAAVPVGLTAHREGLENLQSYNKETAGAVLKIIDKYGDECIEKYGERRVYAADEFYLQSGREIPEPEYYGEFLQLENGVGLWSLLKSEALEAIDNCDYSFNTKREISIATGAAAYPLISNIVSLIKKKWYNLDCTVFAVKNNFFGEKINVAGLVTATDIYEQLNCKNLGNELLIPAVMLRNEGDMFLDSVTTKELEQKLNIKITPVLNDGYDLVDKILGIIN